MAQGTQPDSGGTFNLDAFLDIAENGVPERRTRGSQDGSVNSMLHAEAVREPSLRCTAADSRRGLSV